MIRAGRLGSSGGRLAVGLAGVCVVVGLLAGIKPELGLMAAVGLLVAVVTLSELTLGYLLFVLASFLDLTSSSGSFSGTKVIGLVLFGSWVARIATRREDDREPFTTSNAGLATVLIAMLMWAALSAVWARSSSTALGGAGRYALDMMVFPIGFSAIRERRHVRWLFVAYVVGTVISGAYGLLHATTSGIDAGRLTGLNGDANGEATVLAAGIPLVVALFVVARRSPRTQLLCLVGLVIMFFGLVETLSREGLLSLGAVLVVAVLFGGRWRRYAVMLLVVVASGTIMYYAVAASQSATQRVTMTNSSGRSTIWKVAERVISANPVLGVGNDNFILVERDYINVPGAVQALYIVTSPKVAHNTFLEVGADLGLVGLALFLLIIVLCLRAAVMAAWEFERQGDQDMEIITRALVCAVVAVLTSDFFVASEYAKYLWLPLAFCPIMLGFARRGARAYAGAVPAALPHPALS